jgi:hypothetical protein
VDVRVFNVVFANGIVGDVLALSVEVFFVADAVFVVA